MDIRPSAAVKAVNAPSAQIRHRAHLMRQAKPEVTPSRANVAASRAPEPSTVQPQPERNVAAAVASPEPTTNRKEESAPLQSAQPGAVAGLESPQPSNPDLLVAILMVGPEIRSVADLRGRTIAIDDRYSVPGSTVRTAIVAAGAPQVQLSEGRGTAMNRLSNGEVAAAVVALVTPEAAEKFPEFMGYRIFQVPLSPYAFKARP